MNSKASAKKNLTKYLASYAEHDCQYLPKALQQHTFRHCISIPCYDEPGETILSLIRSQKQENIIFLIIINTPDIATPEAQQRTIKGLLYLEKHLLRIDKSGSNTLYRETKINNFVLIIERTHRTQAIPYKQGVGLARKIGADIACQLYAKGILLSPWIRSTDADVILPSNYIYEIEPQNTSAITYHFKHEKTNNFKLNFAIALYELKMQYYVSALSAAESNYAFHTIGSAQAINIEFYVTVRGFPKRAGGEDFYLLNKLAKIAPIKSDSSISLLIATRTSHRVPFGTGPELKSMLTMQRLAISYKFYHPRCFTLLAAFKYVLHLFWSDSSKEDKFLLSKTQYSLNEQEIEVLMYCFDKLKCHDQLLKSKLQCRNSEHWIRHANEWLDGFRSLKLIHILQDKKFDPISYIELKRTLLHITHIRDSALINAMHNVEEFFSD